MGSKPSYTIEEVKTAVSKSHNMRETILCLGMSPVNGTYVRINRIIKQEGLNTSHWFQTPWNKNVSIQCSVSIPVENYLHVGSTIKASKLKAKCILEGLLDNVCYECGLCPEWEGKPLVLHLDHINGNRLDNRLENLRILCPNCHGQTDTWGTNNSTRYSKGNKQ